MTLGALPLVTVSDGWAAVAGAGVWAGASAVVGYAAHRLPLRRLDHDSWLTRLRPFEADGRWYERRLRIRRWKAWLPEGGDVFDGGFDKGHLRGRTTEHLERFVAETRRAEITHWVLLAVAPTFVLWQPPLVAAVFVAFGVVANVPFALVQRYNRARLQRVLGRRRHRVAT